MKKRRRVWLMLKMNYWMTVWVHSLLAVTLSRCECECECVWVCLWMIANHLNCKMCIRVAESNDWKLLGLGWLSLWAALGLAETGWVWLRRSGSGLDLARSGLGRTGSGWGWLGLAITGWFWLCLAGSGWVWPGLGWLIPALGLICSVLA